MNTGVRYLCSALRQRLCTPSGLYSSSKTGYYTGAGLGGRAKQHPTSCSCSCLPVSSSSPIGPWVRGGRATLASPRRYTGPGYDWPGCRQDIKKHVHQCDACFTKKRPGRRSHASLQQYQVGASMERVGASMEWVGVSMVRVAVDMLVQLTPGPG